MTEPSPMKPEPKRLWLKVLRSGEYRQYKGGMTDLKGAYCPLGLLALVSPYYSELRADDSLLPTSVQKWAGVSEDPLDLTVLNDIYSFSEIASIIEAEL